MRQTFDRWRHCRHCHCHWPARAALLATALSAALWPTPAAAFELTGRASVLGTIAHPRSGDAGHDDSAVDTPTADQQSLRLMLDDHGEASEWSAHLKASRQNFRGIAQATRHSSDLFRWRTLADDYQSGDGARRTTRLGWEIDRAAYKWRFKQASVSLGRQPIDWGSGRLWQPLNVFGSFAPTDLDTDYKSGIDAAVVEWFPSAFSSLTGVYAVAPKSDSSIKDSKAIHYRRQIGETSQLTLVGGEVIGNRVLGAAFESDWRGMGWRIEALHSKIDQTGENALYWVAGIDYQTEGGTLLTAEWHDNGRGATTEAGLARLVNDRLVLYGLQQHRSRRVFGLSLQKDLTPLLRGGYTMLAGALQDSRNHRSTSFLHQLNLVYSLSNESDFLVSVSLATGKGLDGVGRSRSEFGQVPVALMMRWRLYF